MSFFPKDWVCPFIVNGPACSFCVLFRGCFFCGLFHRRIGFFSLSLSLGVSWKSLLYFEFVDFTMSQHPPRFPIPPVTPKRVSLTRSFYFLAAFFQIYWLFRMCTSFIFHIHSLHPKWTQPLGLLLQWAGPTQHIPHLITLPSSGAAFAHSRLYQASSLCHNI